MTVWWGTKVACDSAVARLERSAKIVADACITAFSRLDELAVSWHEIMPTDRVRQIARRLLRVHALRAADSLQLAAALVAAENMPESVTVVCLDDHLLAAARREGLGTL
jgi:hypothetical protein